MYFLLKMEIFQRHDTFRGCNLLFCCGISFQVVFAAPSFANCGSPIKMDDFFEKGKFDGSNFKDSEQGRPKQNCAMCTMATTFFWCGLAFLQRWDILERIILTIALWVWATPKQCGGLRISCWAHELVVGPRQKISCPVAFSFVWE